MYSHQFVKQLLILCRITILNLAHQADENLLRIGISVISQCRTVFQNFHTRGVSVLEIFRSYRLMRDTTIGITITLCESAGYSTRKEQNSDKRFNFHCI